MTKANKFMIVSADQAVRAGRLQKVQQFLAVANDARELADDHEVADATVTLYVHAGIAAADAICVAALRKHAHGTDHGHAIALLASADKTMSKHLETLLKMKTRAGYGHHPVRNTDLLRAERAATALIDRAVA